MPIGDGTGPAGMGPMTGRAAGYCAGYPMPGYMNPYAGGRIGLGRGIGYAGRMLAGPYTAGRPYYAYGFPYGTGRRFLGFGRGRGLGRGRGRW